MKEVTRIHLAKTPYDIEVDARKMLQKYLLDIEKTLHAESDTMTEIESRIVELLAEAGVASGNVITTADIESVQQKLGEPNEFVDTEDTAAQVHGERRLMRDTSSGMLGGVLAGIAAYYSINVMWLRLGAIILGMMSFGTAFIVYLVLWVIMPATKTVADKLQLYGQKVTPNEIKRHVDEFTQDDMRKKPFILVLRGLLSLVWIGAALIACAVLVFGFALRLPLDDTVWRESFTGWTLAMWGLGMLSAVLFIIFCAVLAYASAAWKMNKRLLTVVIALAVAGIVVFSGVVASAIIYRYQSDTMIEQNTHHKTVALDSAFDNATSLIIDGQDVMVDYVVSDKRSMKITSVGDEVSRQVSVKNKDGVATLSIEGSRDDCNEMNRYCSNDSFVVTLYGPALTAITLPTQVEMNYAATNQKDIAITAASSAQFYLSEGRINKVIIDGKRSSSIDVAGGAVSSVEAKIADNMTLRLGNVDTLRIESVNACASNGAATIEAESLNEMVYNGKPVIAGVFDHKCLLLMVNDDMEQE